MIIKEITEEIYKSNEKYFNYLINLNNKDLRKEIENCNWNAILQIIRYCQDYITNLQQENEELEKRNKEIYEGFLATQEELTDYAEENEDYKSRIEKVIRILETLKGSARWERHLYEIDSMLDILNGKE